MHIQLTDADMVSSIGLATSRVDGFVSIDAGRTQGSLTTKPFIFDGNHLLINANAAGGAIKVELMDERGTPLPGFEAERSIALDGDSMRHEVRWRSDSRLADQAGQPIKLRFSMRAVRLYSFVFEP